MFLCITTHHKCCSTGVKCSMDFGLNRRHAAAVCHRYGTGSGINWLPTWQFERFGHWADLTASFSLKECGSCNCLTAG